MCWGSARTSRSFDSASRANEDVRDANADLPAVIVEAFFSSPAQVVELAVAPFPDSLDAGSGPGWKSDLGQLLEPALDHDPLVVTCSILFPESPLHILHAEETRGGRHEI